MRAARTVSIMAALTAALTAAACSAATSEGVDGSPRPAADSLAELEAIYWARLDSARTRFTEADVRFMTGMIGHHAQAIVMARLAPDRAASRSVQTLAARIINAQQDEIGIMQEWLRERGQPVPTIHIDGATPPVEGAGHTMHARGMLSPEQLRELERAAGPDFDRLFLTYMIQHHRGAVTMVRELLGTDGAAQDPVVFQFASDIQADQITEIARMQRMLVEMSTNGAAR